MYTFLSFKLVFNWYSKFIRFKQNIYFKAYDSCTKLSQILSMVFLYEASFIVIEITALAINIFHTDVVLYLSVIAKNEKFL